MLNRVLEIVDNVVNKFNWLRPILDMIMLLMYAALMHISLLGGHVHKGLAGAVGVLFVIHVLLNWRFFFNLNKGSWNRIRMYMLTVDVLLIVGMIFTYASAKMVGHSMFNPVMSAGLKVHQAAAWWVVLIMGWHLGIHGNRIINYFSKENGAQKRFKIVCFIISIIGMDMSRTLNLGQRLMGTFDFRTVAPEDPGIFYGGLLAIVVLNATLSYLMFQILQKRRDDAKPATPRNRAERRRIDRAQEKRAKKAAHKAEQQGTTESNNETEGPSPKETGDK
jgi:hypothetical protein